MTLQEQIDYFRTHRNSPGKFDRRSISDMLDAIEELAKRLEIARSALLIYQDVDDGGAKFLNGFAATENDVDERSVARRALKAMDLNKRGDE
jgi:hypothetical protein